MSRTAVEWDQDQEQYPVHQTLCGTLQRETNWKCFILTSLIIGCIGAITWCRITQVTKVVLNFSVYPMKSSRTMSPCDEGLVYIPVALMAMLYLVYLVECWHCTARVELGYRVGLDSVLDKVQQMKEAQPIVWWKAICYHYVRRKRQVTRYTNGDSYTSTQVYYERVNSHSAGASFVFGYCGVKDISRKLVLDSTTTSITKIRFSKGFAFANVEAAAEFEEQRARFFAEQERYDDYMEMREGLELSAGFREHVVALPDPDRVPWYAGQTAFWVCSFLLLSWPLRIIMEYNTAYLHYQVTKLFGVNYETGVGTSGLTSPESWLPGSNSDGTLDSCDIERSIEENTALVPSYSEAVLLAAGATSATAPRPRTVYYARPLEGGSPPGASPPVSPPPYQEALKLPPLARLRRSLTERGELCAALLPTSRPRTLISMETSL